jgi:hypothetical protein
MTNIASTTGTPGTAMMRNGRSRTLIGGAIAAAAAIVVSVICVYGDQSLTASQQSSQEASLPWIIGVIVVLAGLIFGLGVPRLARGGHPAGWGLAAGIIGIAGFPVYWSGLSIVFGAAALLLGMAGRQDAARNGVSARLATAALVLGVLAIAADVIVSVVTTYL